MDETRLEGALLMMHQQMVHNAVAKVGGEHLARLRAVGDEADRLPRPIAVIAQLGRQAQQVGLGIEFEGLLVERVALAAPALAIVTPECRERIEVAAGDACPPPLGPAITIRREQHAHGAMRS